MMCMRRLVVLLAAFVWMTGLFVSTSHANRAGADEVKVPINIGVGPAFLHFSGAVGDDQTWHTGIELSLAAVIDQETIRTYEHRIPPQYRRLAEQVEEVKVGYLFIPDMLFLSPRTAGKNTGVYGATWRPLAPGISLGGERVKMVVSAGLLLSYAWLHSETLPNTHFLRPGLDGRAEVTWRISDGWLLSGGWSSGLYLPQRIGGFGMGGGTQDAIWHIGRGFGLLHYRLPYAVTIP